MLMVRTGLDAVLRWRDDNERRARCALGAATKEVQAATERLQDARAETLRAAPQHGGACDARLIALSDDADQAALRRERSAEQQLEEARTTHQTAADVHLGARAAQRLIARVVDARRERHTREQAKREQATLDELATLRA